MKLKRLQRLARESVRHQELVILSFICGIGILFIPIQHSFPMARYQHWSLTIFCMSAGMALQALISWRKISIWGRSSLLGSGAFTGFFASYMWFNPWLGSRDLATDQQLTGRLFVVVALVSAVIPLAYCWKRWCLELMLEGNEDENW